MEFKEDTENILCKKCSNPTNTSVRVPWQPLRWGGVFAAARATRRWAKFTHAAETSRQANAPKRCFSLQQRQVSSWLQVLVAFINPDPVFLALNLIDWTELSETV